LDFNPLALTGPFGGLETNAFAKALGKDANHVMGSGYFAPDLKIAETAKFVKQYNEAHSEVPDGVAASCYQGIHAALEGLRRAGSIDREAFREALHAVELKVGDMGIIIPPGIKFSDTGANENARSVYYRWMDGQKQTLLPSEYATVEAVIPRPKWSEIK
jgi:branched-chain amino acid transport system substrate-binding protein